MNKIQECRTVPVREELNNLSDVINQAHNLYSDLHSRIDCVILRLPEVGGISENLPQQSCSEIVNEIKILTGLVKDLSLRIKADLDNIEL